MEIIDRVNTEVIASILAEDARTICFSDRGRLYSVTVCRGVPMPTRVFIAHIFRHFTDGSGARREWGTDEVNYLETMFFLENCAVTKALDKDPYVATMLAVGSLYKPQKGVIKTTDEFQAWIAAMGEDIAIAQESPFETRIPDILTTFTLLPAPLAYDLDACPA